MIVSPARKATRHSGRQVSSKQVAHPATAICAQFSAALRDPSRMLLLQLNSSRVREQISTFENVDTSR
jgi:hypothetical protein